MIRWDVIEGNLPLIAAKLGEHLALTGVAVGVGLVLSFGIVLLVRGRRRWVGPTLAVFGIIYTIPSLALLAFLVPFTRLTFLTAEIALVGYTLLILARNLLAGLDAVPADVLEAADAMGYSRVRRLWQVELPLALPLIVAGIRIATVTTIGLVMVTALIGYGGLGQVMLRGYNFRSDSLVVAGFVLTVALALVADLGLGWLGRTIAPWSRARRAGA
ncbi:MAG TPA: ABC transporter permease [Candidatus Limnocylindrales bacterium]|nr:ABC transporter permease [Candidatus Limnocylindrales bacterium]